MFLFYLCKFSLVMNKLVIYLHTLKPSVCIFYVFLAVLPRAVPRWVEMTFNTLSIYVVFFTRMQRFSLDLLLRGGPSLSFYLITHNPSDLREREREVALESGSGLSTNVPPELIGSATERAQIKGPGGSSKSWLSNAWLLKLHHKRLVM